MTAADGYVFFFQAEDGIRDDLVTGVQTCALPIFRMAFVYVPNGIDMRYWNPSYEGKLGELPRILKPLEPVKDDILMLGNLTHNTGRALLDGAGDRKSVV